MAVNRRGASGPLERAAHAALRESGRTLVKLERRCAAAVAAAAEAMIECLENGGTLYFCGNGGSAADAQHLAAEFSGRYLIDRPGLPAIALTTNTSALTAIGNDYGYGDVFARQLEGLGAPGDVLVAITTSGASPSIRRAVRSAHALGMTVVGMTGAKGAAFASTCDIALVTPHAMTPNVQEGHIVMGHAFCLLVERAMFGGLGSGSPRPGAATRRRRAASGAPPRPPRARRRTR